MKKTNRFIIIGLVFILYLFIGGGCVNAASASIKSNKTTVNVGDTVNITLSYTAAAWDLHVNSSLSTSSTTAYASATEDAKNATFSKSISYKAEKEGTYSINLSGTVSDESDSESYQGKSINQTITVTVKAKQTTTNTNNNSSGTGNNKGNNTTAPSFSSVNQTVYATSEANVRSSYSTSSSIIGSLKQGDSVKRTGVGSNGWSKVTYNGQIAYVSTDLLTTTKPEVKQDDKKDEEKSNKTKILQKIGDKVFNNKTQRERVTIIAIGKMVARAMDIGQRLQEKMDVEVINARFLKPLDDNTIIESIKKTKNVITIEDGTIINGLATAVKEVIVNNNLQGVKIKSYAYPDEFIKHGSVDELEKIYGLDEENIINGVNKS